jgi:hypothetical protein
LRRFWHPEVAAVLAVELLMLAGEPIDRAAETVASAINRDASLPVTERTIAHWRHELWSATAGGWRWPSETTAFARKSFGERLAKLRKRVEEEGADPWVLATDCVKAYGQALSGGSAIGRFG